MTTVVHHTRQETTYTQSELLILQSAIRILIQVNMTARERQTDAGIAAAELDDILDTLSTENIDISSLCEDK